MDRIVSLYWDNIDPRLIGAQRDVFAHFGFDIDQRERTGLNHGDFLDGYMTEIGDDDIALLMDIDCFPLNLRDRRQGAFAAARAGRIFGLRAIDEPCRSRPSVRRADVHGDFAPHLGRAGAAELSPNFRRDQRCRATSQRTRDSGWHRHRDALSLGMHRAEMAPRRNRALRDLARSTEAGCSTYFRSRKTPFSFHFLRTWRRRVTELIVRSSYLDLMEKALPQRGNQALGGAPPHRVGAKAIWWRRLRKALRGGQ